MNIKVCPKGQKSFFLYLIDYSIQFDNFKSGRLLIYVEVSQDKYQTMLYFLSLTNSAHHDTPSTMLILVFKFAKDAVCQRIHFHVSG